MLHASLDTTLHLFEIDYFFRHAYVVFARRSCDRLYITKM